MVARISGSGGSAGVRQPNNRFASFTQPSNVLGISALYPASNPQQPAAPAPAPSAPRSGGGGGGGGFSQPFSAPAPAPVVQPPAEQDWLAQDSGFTTQQSALATALQNYLANANAQTNVYNNDYNSALKGLGVQNLDAQNGADAQWNWLDPLTASGKAYQQTNNDFASRGMLQSSSYNDAQDQLSKMLGQQFDTIHDNRTNWLADMARQQTDYSAQNTAALNSAKAEALARYRSNFGL